MKKPQDEWIKVGGSGVWTEYKNTKTGESSIQSLGKLKDIPDITSFGGCKHYWELTDPTSNSVQCQHCGLGRSIVWGLHKVVKGQIIEIPQT